MDTEVRLKKILKRKFNSKLPFTEKISIEDVNEIRIRKLLSNEVLFKFTLSMLVDISNISDNMLKVTMSRKRFFRIYPELRNYEDLTLKDKDISFYIIYSHLVYEKNYIFCIMEKMDIWFTLSFGKLLNFRESLKLNLVFTDKRIFDNRVKNGANVYWDMNFPYLYSINVDNVIANNQFSTINIDKNTNIEEYFNMIPNSNYTISNKVYNYHNDLIYFVLTNNNEISFNQIGFLKIENDHDNIFYSDIENPSDSNIYLLQSVSKWYEGNIHDNLMVTKILPAEYWYTNMITEIQMLKKNTLDDEVNNLNYTLHDRLNTDKLLTESSSEYISSVGNHKSYQKWR